MPKLKGEEEFVGQAMPTLKAVYEWGQHQGYRDLPQTFRQMGVSGQDGMMALYHLVGERMWRAFYVGNTQISDIAICPRMLRYFVLQQLGALHAAGGELAKVKLQESEECHSRAWKEVEKKMRGRRRARSRSHSRSKDEDEM